MADIGGGIAGGGDVFSDVMQFIGSALAWDETSKQINREIRAADDNAQIAAAASADAIRRGNIEAGKLRMQGTLAASEAAVAYQGAGVDATVGTAAENQGAIAQGAELDAQVAANNAAREAWGQRRQKTAFEAEKQAAREKYNAAQTQYSLNQVGTIVKTGGDAWSMAMKL